MEELKKSYEELSQKMNEVLVKIKEIEEDMRNKLKQWDEKSITPIINGSINEIKERYKRVSLVEDKIQELIEEGTLLIDTEGAVAEQVNGLSVYPIGEFLFGNLRGSQPQRR